MTAIQTPSADEAGSDALLQRGGATAAVCAEATEVLFREARRRERRRRSIVTGSLVVLAGLTAGLVAASGGGPPIRPSASTPSGEGGSSLGVGGNLTLRGNGFGGVRFGEVEAIAIARLDRLFGTPQIESLKPERDCTVDSWVSWSQMSAYFDHQRFVGYNTATLQAGTGRKQVIPDASTAAGLRVGSSIARAKAIYGRSLKISLAQGGSWFATTSTGTLDGYLTAVPDHPTPPVPRVADISAGSVGCPAESP